MRPYCRFVAGFAITAAAIVLCYLGARAELLRPPRDFTYVDGSESQQAYQFCLRHNADGCQPEIRPESAAGAGLAPIASSN